MGNLKLIYFIPIFGVLKVEKLNPYEDMFLMAYQSLVSAVIIVIATAWLMSPST